MKILVRTNNMPNMIYVSVKQQVKSFFGKNFRFNMIPKIFVTITLTTQNDK